MQNHGGGEPIPAVVHIVDDDPSFRTSTGRLLRACGYVVETHESAERLLTRWSNDLGESCILLDIRMPGLGGPELQEQLSAIGSTVPIIFLTGYADIPTTVQVIKSGAEDLLTKPVEKDRLVGAIERALGSVRALQARHEQLGPLRNLVSHLTPRERQVFERVVRGKMNKEIARELGTTERTIKAHRHQVMSKMKVTSLAELVIIAERLRVLGGGERPRGGGEGQAHPDQPHSAR